jgi:hypothetical protein
MTNVLTCRSASCQQEIFYIDYNGRKHPANAKPKKVFVGINNEWQLLTGYESHFATCKDADRWRSIRPEHKSDGK